MKPDNCGVPCSRFSLILLLVHLVDESRCEVYKSLHWTPENPVFMPNSSGCDYGEVPQMNVLPSSKIHIICPTPVTVLETVQSTKPKQNLFENLWIIYDNKSFETCNVNTSNAELIKKKNRQLMQCDKPLELKYFTIVFQPFSAVSGGLEFAPGKEYNFLATSDGTQGSLGDSAGGHCNDTKNGVSMKFKVYVCYDESDSRCIQRNAKLGTLYYEKTGPSSTAIAPTPSSCPVLTSSMNPAATSKMPCEAMTHTVLVNRTVCENSRTPGKFTIAPSSSGSLCVCRTVVKDIEGHSVPTIVSSVSPSSLSAPTENSRNLTTEYPTVTHTIMAGKSTVIPSSSGRRWNGSTVMTKVRNHPAHSQQTPNSNLTSVYSTITHTQFVCRTVCNGGKAATPSPSARAPLTTDASSVVAPPKNSCPGCGRSKEAQQGFRSTEDKGTWMPLAIVFICTCVIVLLAFGIIYIRKDCKKRVNKVTPSSDVPTAYTIQ